MCSQCSPVLHCTQPTKVLPNAIIRQKTPSSCLLNTPAALCLLLLENNIPSEVEQQQQLLFFARGGNKCVLELGWLCDVGVAGGGNGLRSEGRGQRNFSGGEEGGSVGGCCCCYTGQEEGRERRVRSLPYLFAFSALGKNMPFPAFTKESSFLCAVAGSHGATQQLHEYLVHS